MLGTIVEEIDKITNLDKSFVLFVSRKPSRKSEKILSNLIHSVTLVLKFMDKKMEKRVRNIKKDIWMRSGVLPSFFFFANPATYIVKTIVNIPKIEAKFNEKVLIFNTVSSEKKSRHGLINTKR